MKQLTLAGYLLKAILPAMCCIGGALETDAQNYKLITSTEDLEAGKTYLVASMASGAGAVMKSYESGNSCAQVAATSDGGTIAREEGMAQLTLKADGKNWQFMDANGRYMTATKTTSDNYLQFVNKAYDSYSFFSIAFTAKSNAIVTCTGKDSHNILMYNTGYKRFACYNSMDPVYLYKEVEEANPVTSLAITGTPAKNWYMIGDRPSAEGLAVEATHADGTTRDVTAEAAWTFDPERITGDVTQVKATATYGKASASTTFTVYVNKPASLSISGTPNQTSYRAGTKPSADGLAVKATYTDGTVKDITGDVAWSFDPATITGKVTQVTVTATAAYMEMTAQTTFDVEVVRGGTNTLDLTTQTYIQASTEKVTWDIGIGEMKLERNGSSTPANQAIGNNGKSCAYESQILTITPYESIAKIVLVVTTSDYANKFPNHTITNAELYVNSTAMELVPTDPGSPVSIKFANACHFTKLTAYATVTATISDAGYTTLCLPYAARTPVGLTAYAAKDNGSTITLVERGDGFMAAGEGLVVQGAAGTYAIGALAGVATKVEGNNMVGVNKDTPLDASTGAYLLSRNKATGKTAFRLLNTSYTMPANKAYLKPSAASNSRTMIDVDDYIETGIGEPAGAEAVTAPATIYNLSGHRLSRIRKGINIVNGKLVVM